MSKSIIMTTSAALVLMTSVAFSGQRGLDESTIHVLTNSSPQTAVLLLGPRGKSVGKGSSANFRARYNAMGHVNGNVMLVLEYEAPQVDLPREESGGGVFIPEGGDSR